MGGGGRRTEEGEVEAVGGVGGVGAVEAVEAVAAIVGVTVMASWSAALAVG